LREHIALDLVATCRRVASSNCLRVGFELEADIAEEDVAHCLLGRAWVNWYRIGPRGHCTRGRCGIARDSGVHRHLSWLIRRHGGHFFDLCIVRDADIGERLLELFSCSQRPGRSNELGNRFTLFVCRRVDCIQRLHHIAIASHRLVHPNDCNRLADDGSDSLPDCRANLAVVRELHAVGNLDLHFPLDEATKRVG